MNIIFSKAPAYLKHTQIVGCFENILLTQEAKELDEKTQGFIQNAIKSSRFRGKIGQVLPLYYPCDQTATRFLIVGLGLEEELSPYGCETIGGAIYTALASTPETAADVLMASLQTKTMTSDTILSHMAHGYTLRSWRYENHKTKKKDDTPKALETLSFVTQSTTIKALFDDLYSVTQGVAFTKDLVTRPPNDLYPESMVHHLKSLESLGVKLEILDEDRLKALNMGCLLGVAQGSENKPYVAIMTWMNGGNEAPVALVGKGVTFDSGGLNLKPTGFMEDMKQDMAGAGAVAGIMKTLALRQAKVNVVGAVGLVENMVSGKAQRPSDIVTTCSGQTVEILNTDAEGRLVLADVLWYVQETFKPTCMVDLATLTGAIVITLGDQFAGLFSDNDDLAQALKQAGHKVHERLWQLPLHKDYDKDIDSDIADMKNIGSGRKAGSITAAQFLKRFTNNVPWAHIDIAGIAWHDKPSSLHEKGASAFGVRLLNQWIKDSYEH